MAHVALRRIGPGDYVARADERFAIVRHVHEYHDDEGHERTARLWEILEHREYGWEVGHVGYPTTTLREARALLAVHLAA